MPREKKNTRAPAFIEPMAAQVVDKLPEGPDWLYELKFDGYRALLIKHEERVRLHSRKDKDLTSMYPGIVEAGEHLDADLLVLDGEIVALAEDGRPSFQALQHRSAHAPYTIVYYAFDVLHLEGRDLTTEVLTKRRMWLPKVVGKESTIRLSQNLPGTAPAVMAAVRGVGGEGVIAKRKDSMYQPGERSRDWVKLKLEEQQEFVIGGYRPDGPDSLDALLVGYYERGELMFAGKVRAGFIPPVRREVLRKLKPLRVAECPFAKLPDDKKSRWGAGITAEEMRQMQWTKPQLVAQIRFVEFTADGRLRHAAFLGLREDKTAREIRREL